MLTPNAEQLIPLNSSTLTPIAKSKLGRVLDPNLSNNIIVSSSEENNNNTRLLSKSILENIAI